MTRRSPYIIPLLLAALLGLAACTDTLYDDLQQGGGYQDGDGMGFSVSTQEQNDVIIALGSTRAAQVISPEGTQAREHQLEGDNAYGLKLHSLPLPLVGIHEKAASADCCVDNATNGTATNGSTRANADTDIATSSHFHDSLTIWGFTNKQRVLFRQVTLKKVRDWRSSVHWPYDNEAEMDDLQSPSTMKFYAISPSMEEMEITILNRTDMQQVSGTSYYTASGAKNDAGYKTVNYNQPPIFEYRVADDPAEQKDLLVGSSGEIDIQSGPTGITSGSPEKENLGKDNKKVDLKFKHVLTAIRFAQGKIPPNVYIEDITLYHIKSRRIYDNGWAIEGLDDYETNKKYYGSYTIKTGRTTYMGDDGNYQYDRTGENSYIDGGNVLFMIPHELSSNAELHVTLREKLDDSGGFKTHNLKCSLSGETWNEGYTVIYELTIGKLQGDYILFASNPAEIEAQTETTSTFPVNSYRKNKTYSSEQAGVESWSAVDWQVVGFKEQSDRPASTDEYTMTKPSWLLSIDGASTTGTTNLMQSSNTTGANPGTANFTVQQQTATKSGNHKTILSSNTVASDKDLSADGTANCYIVNTHGSFTFPLVYGNGNVDSSNTLFVDHEGKYIKSSSIHTQLATFDQEVTEPAAPAENDTKTIIEYPWDTDYIRARLIWQDVEGMVSSVAANLSTDKIGFSINQSKIQPGNAVIALEAKKRTTTYTYTSVTNENGDPVMEWAQTSSTDETDWQVVWTWHIWVTDEVFPNYETTIDQQYLTFDETTNSRIVSLQDKDGNAHNIMPVNLGWVPDDMDWELFDKREVWVLIKQPITGATQEIKIVQHARQPLITGTSTVYQWGRPVVLPALTTIADKKRTIYVADGESSEFNSVNISTIQEAITKPLNWVRHKDCGNDDHYWWKVSSESDNYNFWGNKGTSTTKTIYDPCPSGFFIPQSSIFTGLSLTGQDATEGKYLNMWEQKKVGDTTYRNGAQKIGGYFYWKAHSETIPKEDRYGKMFYLPATGFWKLYLNKHSMTGQLDDESKAMLWTCEQTGGMACTASSIRITPQKSSSSEAIQLNYPLEYGNGIPIRPMK